MIVFLGGTCNNSTWRDRLIPLLKVEYFNPVVDDWTEEAYEEEIRHRENDDLILYVITPLQNGVYSIAEAVQDSNVRPEKTIVCLLREDDKLRFDNTQWKSMLRTRDLCKRNGATILDSLESVATYINNFTAGS